MSRAIDLRASASRLRAGAARLSVQSSTATGLAVLFAAGTVIRLVLAGGGGFPYDIGTFASWADRLATLGPGAFYDDPDFFVDYPPGYLYVLWMLGGLSRALSGSAPGSFLLKMPAIGADLVLAWLAVVLTRRLTPSVRASRVAWDGPAAAAILLNPAVLYVSAVWGQVEAVHSAMVLGGFILLGTREPTARREAGGLALLMLAFLTKPQAGFVIPIAVLVLLWRHVRSALAEDGRRQAAVAAARVAGLGIVSLAFGLVVAAPFGLSPAQWLAFYQKAAATYPYTSVWAFNFWGAVAFWRRDVPGDGALTAFGISPLWIGIALFVALASVVCVRAWRALQAGEHEGRVLLFGGAALTLAGFATLTRIHERYLFVAIVCLVPLLAHRWMRRAAIALSMLYLLNVYFAFAYYIDLVGRSTFKIDWLFRAVYGVAQNSAQKKLLSAATGLVCAVVAVHGWRWLRDRRLETAAGEETAGVAAFLEADEDDLPLGVARPGAWPGSAVALSPGAEGRGRPARARLGMQLHSVGRIGAIWALGVTAVVLATRLVGLSTPTGMYFDEVYHARTGGEYLQGKEVYEWTHPPLAKELMAVSLSAVSGLAATAPRQLPASIGPGALAIDGGVLLSAVPAPGGGVVRRARIDASCGLRPEGEPVAVPVSPSAIAAAGTTLLVAGAGASGPALTRIERGEEAWQVRLPAEARRIVMVGEVAFVLTETGSLFRVPSDGAAVLVAEGAAGLTGGGDEPEAWASFPAQSAVRSFATGGEVRADIGVQGQPGPLVASSDADRVLVVDTRQGRIESIDTESKTRIDELAGAAPSLFAIVPETGLIWAASGATLSLVEPRGLSIIGSVKLSQPAAAVLADPAAGVVAVGDDAVQCATARPQFAWRLGSAIFGAIMCGLVLLLALRLFGSLLVGVLAASFLALDGLAFVMSRIAMNDSYVTAFILAAWFCALSVLYQWGLRSDGVERSRVKAAGWLVAMGAAAGLAAASKWVGLYAIAGIGLLFLYDAIARGADGIPSLFGAPAVTVAVGVLVAGIFPLAIYVASYVPYFDLGHGVVDLVRLQKGMYDYHAKLTADHPYGSPWYGWPVGRRAVWLYLGTGGSSRAEIWTAANPIVFLGGLVGLVAIGYQGVRLRAAALFVPILGALVQYLPWVAVSRVTFLYHYLPVVPFLSLALAWWVGIGRKGVPRTQRMLEIGAVGGASLLAFILLLPIIDGWMVSEDYLKSLKTWLGWMFAVQS